MAPRGITETVITVRYVSAEELTPEEIRRAAAAYHRLYEAAFRLILENRLNGKEFDYVDYCPARS